MVLFSELKEQLSEIQTLIAVNILSLYSFYQSYIAVVW